VIRHRDISAQELTMLFRKGSIQMAGNARLKIYGLLKCASGKRMKLENRVFFETETEALQSGFRPCGHCMRDQFLEWKKSR
jgi:methylphosphotriester-DNA--protein-cysteine methyltransferase